MSLISLAIGGAAGMIKFIIGKYLDNKHQQQISLIQRAEVIHKDRLRATEMTSKGVSFTRRVLAIIFALALTSPVFYGLLYPDTIITVPAYFIEKTSLFGWILPFGNEEVMRYIEVKSPVIAMPIYEMCAMIIGFYFGSGGSRVR